MSKKHKKVCRVANYIGLLLASNFIITEYVSISAFASLVRIPIGVTSSAVELKICSITAAIQRYKSIIKKNKKKHDKIVLLAKSKLKSVEVLISKALIDSSISHDELVLTNNVLKQRSKLYIKQCCLIV